MSDKKEEPQSPPPPPTTSQISSNMTRKDDKERKDYTPEYLSSTMKDAKRNNGRNTNSKESRSGKLDKSKERCYNYDGIGQFAADYKKPRAEKKQVLISKKKNWDDSSESDDTVNYALMENVGTEGDNVELKVPRTTLAFDTDDIYELRLFINSKETDNVVYVKEKLLEKHAYLEKDLAKEREVIKLWTNSGKITQEILENGCWGSGLGYDARSNYDKKTEKETEKNKPVSTDIKVKLNKVQLKTIKFNPSVDVVRSVNEKQLKQKLTDLQRKDKKKKPRKNRNGKVGVNKNGLSSSRPPLFDGTNFATWKTRFRIYSRSQGVKVWMVIEDGVRIPTKTIDDIIVEKKAKAININTYSNANASTSHPVYTPPKPKDPSPEETQDVCFEYKQPNHYKREYPKLSKGRSLVAENGWDLSEDEETPEASEEVVNLCLMALGDETTSTEISSSNQEVTFNYVSIKSLLDESNLSLIDMNKHDLIELVVSYKNKYKDVEQRFHLLWSEKIKIEEIPHTQNKEYTRMMDSKVQDENEITSLKDQNHLIKIEVNKLQENILNLEMENISLILKDEEMEREKIQLNDNICKLHVDLLDLKILNESNV
ncbi:hypothetical protein AgCh_009571 [Apium graveolens]